jgi:Mg2+ and Co2+ transporter CorA
MGKSITPQNINMGKKFSLDERQYFIKFFKEYKYIFSWMYEYLKTYDTKIMQHIIPMKPQANPFQQKLRKMHPSLESQVKAEMNKF